MDYICQFVRMFPNATIPSKNNASDSGYDLTLIGIEKKINNVTLFKTGIKVKPPNGFYFDLVPRSSIIKYGYILANSIGIIDADYTGEILVPLIKIDDNCPDIDPDNEPLRLVQLIPRKRYNFSFNEVESLNMTIRSDKGFGSSGN